MSFAGRCSKATLIEYNSDSGKTQEIGFEVLQVGDYVVIGLYDNEKAQAQTETVQPVCRANETKICAGLKKHLQSAA